MDLKEIVVIIQANSKLFRYPQKVKVVKTRPIIRKIFYLLPSGSEKY